MKFYTVTLRQEALGQQIINRWNYSVAGSGSGASSVELLHLMGFLPASPPPTSTDGTIEAAILAVQSVSLQHIEFECAELYTPTDFYTGAYSPGIAGAVDEGISSITDAYGLFSSRVRTDIKRGFKRIAGVPPSAYAQNSELASGFQIAVGVLGERMSLPLEGATVLYDPSVFQFEAYTTPSGKTAYKKYADPEVQAEHVAADVEWAIYDTIRTQVSRQIGRGS